jgi:hypothetical protein
MSNYWGGLPVGAVVALVIVGAVLLSAWLRKRP